MNIIVPGAKNPDPAQELFDFVGGPLHGSKLPVHPKIQRMGMEVGLMIGGKMACYRKAERTNTAGHKWVEYHFVEMSKPVQPNGAG